MSQFGGLYPRRVRLQHELTYGTAENTRDVVVRHYEAHNRRVQETIPMGQLLVVDVSQPDSMHALCLFLNNTSELCTGPSPVFPHVNARGTHGSASTYMRSLYSLPAVNKARSKFAYVSVVTVYDDTRSRAELSSFLSATATLKAVGCKHDVVLVVCGEITAQERDMLARQNVKIVDIKLFHKFKTGDTATLMRALFTPFGLVAYERVMYFAPSTRFQANCDRLIESSSSSFETVSTGEAPIHYGLYIAKPVHQVYVDLIEIAMNSASFFKTDNGWFGYGPIPDWRVKGRRVPWDFPRASTLGYLYYYYACLKEVSGAKIHDVGVWDALARFQ